MTCLRWQMSHYTSLSGQDGKVLLTGHKRQKLWAERLYFMSGVVQWVSFYHLWKVKSLLTKLYAEMQLPVHSADLIVGYIYSRVFKAHRFVWVALKIFTRIVLATITNTHSAPRQDKYQVVDQHRLILHKHIYTYLPSEGFHMMQRSIIQARSKGTLIQHQS